MRRGAPGETSTPAIRPYRPGDERAVLALHEEAFGTRQSRAQWQWRYRDLPLGESTILLAWAGERCIGQFAYSPMPLTLDGAPVDALAALEAMVHPVYRATGLLSALERAADREVDRDRPRYGFATERTHSLFVGSLGWRSLGAPRVLVKLLGPSGLRHGNRLLHLLAPVAAVGRWRDVGQRGHVPIRQFSRFHEIEASLPTLATPGLHLRRQPDLLDWRYRSGPHPYRLFAFGPEGGEVGFAVVRIQEDSGLQIAWLAELAIAETAREETPTILRALASELHGDADLLSSLLPHARERVTFRRAGFWPAPHRLLPQRPFLISKGDSARQTEFDDPEHWYLTWGLHDAI